MDVFKKSKPTVAYSGDMDKAEKLSWLQLIRTPSVGPITFYKLIEFYGSATNALDALPELAKKGGRKKPLIAIERGKVEAEYNALIKKGGDLICAIEAHYPLGLGATEDAPPVLSYIGNIRLARAPCLGVVGARNASLNGRKFTKKITGDLGAAGQIIVSGLARGIDTAAHEASLPTGTIAVVAGGIDVVYPRENQKLYEDICAQGLVIAESPLGVEPIARHFPKRNRIVSGISSGVLVVEATLRSGSLITARNAGEQGRDVYAVPGYPMDPRAQGPNKLIQDGATLVQNADDILNALSTYSGGNSLNDNNAAQAHYNAPITNAARADISTEKAQALILQNLTQMPLAVDELINACHLTIPEVQLALLELELSDRLQRLPGNRVALLD